MADAAAQEGAFFRRVREDASAVGAVALKVHRCEGALDTVAATRARRGSSTCGQAASFHETQRRALLHLQAARARERVVSLAREKLYNLDGRLEMGERLYGSSSAGSAKALARNIKLRAEAQLAHAREARVAAKGAQSARERSLGRSSR